MDPGIPFLNSAGAACLAVLRETIRRAPRRGALILSGVAVSVIGVSVTTILTVQGSTGSLDVFDVANLGSPADQSVVKYIGELKPVDAPALEEQPAMIDIALASVDVGPQAERCGSEPVGKEKLKEVVERYVSSNRSKIRTQLVGAADALTVMACVYPNDFFPGQALLSVAVPSRLPQPIFIAVSDDCVKRVNDAMARGEPIPLDCKPATAPIEPETLLIPVSLAEVGQ